MKLRILTPAYGGSLCTNYVSSLISAIRLGNELGIQIDLNILDNESCIARARNKLAHLFWNSDSTHALFWDADIGMRVPDLQLMLHRIQKLEPDAVMGGVYPLKDIKWEYIKQAVKDNPDVRPQALATAGSDFVFNVLDTDAPADLLTPMPVHDVGTGLLLIPREALERFQTAYPDDWYAPLSGDMPGASPMSEQKMWAYFEDRAWQSPIADQRNFLTEDYYFCMKLRNAGVRIYLAPWVITTHRGTYDYPGNVGVRQQLLEKWTDAVKEVEE